MVNYDVIIIGAGSVGVPTAFSIAREGLNVLCIDKNYTIGQSQNKRAIGGVRATHSQEGKIHLCQRSLEIFRNWEEEYGEDIDWVPGGYCFVAYTDADEQLLKETVEFQKKAGLNIDWVDPDKIKELVPGINDNNLRGGTFSPEDGTVSPLLSINAFYRQALNSGADFLFQEKVIDILTQDNTVAGVKTEERIYNAPIVINAAGAYAKQVAAMAGIDVPVQPDSHEAGITEMVQQFFSTMVVDIRPETNEQFGNSKNFYFYQNGLGQIIFCLTPSPPIVGYNTNETSNFLPQISQRLIKLLPRLRNIKVRRTWRGLYPMTPDGNPIIGEVKKLEGYINAVGMCGQGFMLAPGLSELLARVVTNKTTKIDKEILEEFSLHRDFAEEELLK